MDVVDARTPTPPDAGPDEEVTIQAVIGQVTEIADLEQPPEQMMPVQSPDEVAPEFVEMLQPQAGFIFVDSFLFFPFLVL